MRKICILAVLLCTSSTLAAFAPQAAAFPTNRDPISWPFVAGSIWNMPIHNDAEYVDAQIGMPMAAGPIIDPEILILQPDAPLKPLVENDAGWDGNPRCTSLTGNMLLPAVPVPDDFATYPEGEGSTPNNSGAILMPDGVTLYQTQPLHVCGPGGIVTSQYSWETQNIRTGAGIEGSHGGSGMSAFGGSIRVGELAPGSVIRHAIKMNFFAERNYFFGSDETPGYRWPAPHADGYANAETYGGTVPAFEIGALLALKPDFDVSSLRTEPARIIARASRDYGIYTVDDTYWDVFHLLVEEGAQGSVYDQFRNVYGYDLEGPALNCAGTSDTCKWSQDMWTILQNLNVVDNNSATTIGGGPNSDTANRRAPMAPPFLPAGARTRVGLQVKPGQRAVRAGGRTSYRAVVSNRGGIAATGARFCFSGPRGAIAPAKRCVQIGNVAAGASRSVNVKLRVKGNARPRAYRLKFRLKANNANPRRLFAFLRVKPRR